MRELVGREFQRQGGVIVGGMIREFKLGCEEHKRESEMVGVTSFTIGFDIKDLHS